MDYETESLDKETDSRNEISS